MPEYDRQRFRPPAPMAKVIVRTLDHAQSVFDVPMLIDSGADATLIPQVCAEQLKLPSEIETRFRLQDYRGGVSAARVVDAEVVFLGHNFRGRFLVIDNEWGIVGRNMLNHLSLLFDGPHLTWQEVPSGH